MRDGVIRIWLKRLARWAKTVDLGVTRKLNRPARHRLAGSCNGCGRCCEAPTIQVTRVTYWLPRLRALVLWWQRVVNGFELTSVDPRFHLFTFRCTHYDPSTKQCDSYQSRPLMCRDYPVNLTFDATPTLFDECSHRIVDTNAVALRAALVASGLKGEALAEVEKKLYLTE